MADVRYTADGRRWERTGLHRPTKPRQHHEETASAFAVRLEEWRELDRAYMRAYDKRRRELDSDYVQARQKSANEWKKRNSESVSDYRRQYGIDNRDKERATNARWLARNPGIKAEYDANYRRRNSEKVKAYFSSKEFKIAKNAKARERYNSDPAFRTEKVLRASLTQSLRLYGDGKKRDRLIELIGCTIKELTVHLEKLFHPGMNWDNQGKWHVDHIIPCASFDLSDPVHQLECFHWSNLQPLWGPDNIRKGKRLDWTPPLEEAA
jgi:hypothetical protein